MDPGLDSAYLEAGLMGMLGERAQTAKRCKASRAPGSPFTALRGLKRLGGLVSIRDLPPQRVFPESPLPLALRLQHELPVDGVKSGLTVSRK